MINSRSVSYSSFANNHNSEFVQWHAILWGSEDIWTLSSSLFGTICIVQHYVHFLNFIITYTVLDCLIVKNWNIKIKEPLMLSFTV